MTETTTKFQVYGARDLDTIPQLAGLDARQRLEMKAVAAVLPFRVNRYVVESLIDWSRAPDDPMYRLTFPQPEMLQRADLERMVALLRRGAPSSEVDASAREIQARLNPHPAGQQELNVPRLPGGRALPGAQHKYAETVLFFPSQGQTCHAYCSYCFRWAQFVGLEDLRFASRETEPLTEYLTANPGVTNVLLTGGDPMIMRTKLLRRYIEPLLAVESLQSVRIGTKAPAYWPQRFVTDRDADDLLRLFEDVRAAGKHVAVMAHYTHPAELSTDIAQRALARIRSAGAVVRTQSPLLRGINDQADTWAELWRTQVRHGAIPYYMFVERDTGARHYFEVPLARALEVYNGAIRQSSGLGRTARGPSMSATPGKVLIDGVAEVHGERVFVLKFLQARDPAWVGRPFFARFDPSATWLRDLEPAFDAREFFFEPGMRGFRDRARLRVVDTPATARTQPS